MKKLVFTTVALLWSATGWAGHSYDLKSAAYDLKYATDHLYKELHYRSGYSYASKGAKALARAAKRFHYEVKHGRSPHYLWKEYRRLADCYYDFRSTLHYSREYDYVARDFRAVSGAFSALRSAMEYRKHSRHSRSHSYSSRGYSYPGRTYAYLDR